MHAAELQPESLQSLADHARFQELLPAFHGVPAPPRFHFGTFPAGLAAYFYNRCNLGPAGVWSSDALTVGPTLLLRTVDGALVEAPALNWQEPDISQALARGGAADPAEAAFLAADAALIVTAGYPGYGHWLADILPRLILLERAGHALERLTFLVPPDMPPFARPLLDVFGIGAASLHVLSAPVRPRRLLMPTFPHNGRQFMALAEDGFRLLQARLAARSGQASAAGTTGRMLVSRHGWGSRPLQNRPAFEALAKEHGFATVAPHQLPLIQQFQLFAGAHAIVGEYGSGLHNAIFSPPGTVVAAIRGPLGHPAFLQSGIGDALRQPTGYVFGTCGDHVDHPDFRVDLDAVRDCLRAVFPAGPYRPAFQAAPAVAAPVALHPPPVPDAAAAAAAAANALPRFRQARLAGDAAAAIAAGDLLLAEGDDRHRIAAALAGLCHQCGRAADAVFYAVTAAVTAPGDTQNRELLAALLPAAAPAHIAAAPAIDTALHIDFRNTGNAAAMLGAGWGRHAPRRRWMLHQVSTLNLGGLDARFDWLAELDIAPFSLPARLRIVLGNVPLHRVSFAADAMTPLRFRIPAEVLAAVSPHTLHFEHPDARTPRSLDGRDDDRMLAFKVRTLSLTPVCND